LNGTNNYAILLEEKVKDVCTALHGNPPQSYGASPDIWDHTD